MQIKEQGNIFRTPCMTRLSHHKQKIIFVLKQILTGSFDKKNKHCKIGFRHFQESNLDKKTTINKKDNPKTGDYNQKEENTKSKDVTDDAPIDNPCNNENKLSDQRSHGEFDGKSSIEEICEGIHICIQSRSKSPINIFTCRTTL